MTDIDLLVDFHKDAIRQGPGSVEDTLKALSYLEISKPQNLKIADIGCGSGAQTITLAQNVNGQITAVDIFPEFLNILNSKAKNSGLQKRIHTLTASMDNLPFQDKSLDIIWSEGAIYNMGFENGIKNWNKFLKKGGHLAVSEVTWITDSRPQEIEEFWITEYPEIDTASNKIKVLKRNGFIPVGYFILSESSWIENYYKPMENRFIGFLDKHNHSEQANKIVESHKEEMALYLKYKNYYSYGFYIAKKV